MSVPTLILDQKPEEKTETAFIRVETDRRWLLAGDMDTFLK